MFKIPQDNKFFQANGSDKEGNIYATKNITFDDAGYIKLSDGIVSIFSEADNSDFRRPAQMTQNGDYMFAGARHIFRNSGLILTSSLSDLTSSESAPTISSENGVIYFNDNLVVSDSTTGTRYRDGGSWTAISGEPIPGSAEPTVLGLFEAQNSMLIGAGQQVAIIDTDWNVKTTLSLPDQYVVQSVCSNGDTVFVVTRNKNSQGASLFTWDGATSTWNGLYSLKTNSIVSVKKYGASVVLLTDTGQLLYFTGNSFEELAHFPNYPKRLYVEGTGNDYGIAQSAGMVVEGDRVYIAISYNFNENNSYLSNMPHGIWCYDPRVGLYHKHLPSRNYFVHEDVFASKIDITTDTFTSSKTLPATGSPVFYYGAGANIGGLLPRRWYYIIKKTSTTFQLAQSKSEAHAGNYINLTSNTSSDVDFYYPTKKDYGHSILEDDAIVLELLNSDVRNNLQLGRTAMIYTAYNNDFTDYAHLGVSSDKVETRGYIITPKMFSSEIEDEFLEVVIKYKKLDYGDSIVVKYKNEEKNLPTEFCMDGTNYNGVTWSSNTTFTTQGLDFSELEVGDEIEVVAGAGAGVSSHISSITNNGGLYTITLEDENEFISSGDKSLVIGDNWKKLKTIDRNLETTGYAKLRLDKVNTFIQLKIELRGVGVTIEDIIINNKPYKRVDVV